MQQGVEPAVLAIDRDTDLAEVMVGQLYITSFARSGGGDLMYLKLRYVWEQWSVLEGLGSGGLLFKSPQ